MVPADSDGIPRVPPYSGYRYARSCFVYGAVTRYGRTFQNVPLTFTVQQRGPTTPTLHCYSTGLGSSPVARHYWGNHCLFSVPGGTKMFQFPPFASILSMDDCPSDSRVVPFGNPRIKDYLHLPAAYRSLSRPSSPPRAKASAMRPFLLFLVLHEVLIPLADAHTFSYTVDKTFASSVTGVI